MKWPVRTMAALGITLTIAFDCLMTFFGSLANDACFNAWMTDIIDDTNRGRVEGVNSAMPLLSMLVGPWIGSSVSASSGVVGFGVVGDGFAPSSLIFAAGAAVSLLTFVALYLIRREEKKSSLS